jgi:hypothetical protein
MTPRRARATKKTRRKAFSARQDTLSRCEQILVETPEWHCFLQDALDCGHAKYWERIDSLAPTGSNRENPKAWEPLLRAMPGGHTYVKDINTYDPVRHWKTKKKHYMSTIETRHSYHGRDIFSRHTRIWGELADALMAAGRACLPPLTRLDKTDTDRELTRRYRRTLRGILSHPGEYWNRIEGWLNGDSEDRAAKKRGLTRKKIRFAKGQILNAAQQWHAERVEEEES